MLLFAASRLLFGPLGVPVVWRKTGGEIVDSAKILTVHTVCRFDAGANRVDGTANDQ